MFENQAIEVNNSRQCSWAPNSGIIDGISNTVHPLSSPRFSIRSRRSALLDTHSSCGQGQTPDDSEFLHRFSNNSEFMSCSSLSGSGSRQIHQAGIVVNLLDFTKAREESGFSHPHTGNSVIQPLSTFILKGTVKLYNIIFKTINNRQCCRESKFSTRFILFENSSPLPPINYSKKKKDIHRTALSKTSSTLRQHP